jgi:hypothetical protein
MEDPRGDFRNHAPEVTCWSITFTEWKEAISKVGMGTVPAPDWKKPKKR